MRYDTVIIGQIELALERFRDDTRHMIIGGYEEFNLHMTGANCVDYA